MQQGDPSFSSLRALRELVARVGARKITVLGALALAASLSEGIGLFLLIPVAHAISGGGNPEPPQVLAAVGDLGAGRMLVGLVALISVRAIIVYAANELRRGIQLDLSLGLRDETHQAISQAEWRWLAGQESADHAALIVGEVERSASLFGDAVAIFSAVATIGILGLAALVASPALTAASVLFGIPILAAIILLRSRRSHEGNAYWDALSRLQGSLANGIAKLRAARIAGAEGKVVAEFAESSSSLSELERTYFRRGHQIQTLVQISAALALAGLIFFALEVGHVSLALLIPVLALAVRGFALFNQAYQAWRSWRYNKPALARVLGAVSAARLNRENHIQPTAPISLEREIELRDLTLQYEGRDRPVLSNCSLRIRKGDLVAITGPSGAGKSSLADILGGLALPDRGGILVDGKELSPSQRLAWREQVGYLEQQPFFFSASVRENLCWGCETASDTDVAEAVAQASANFVLGWPEGLETRMGEGGRQLSGGERRRLALARTLLAKPSVLILDEFTASIDHDHAEAIIRAVSSLKGEKTIVAFTHDARVVEIADSVFELGAGT